ncbi:hypothetical protein KM043_016290 [Ampulex compressa]|nr:hypothetical protein KM043_016290 [Ampulex compressa]
MMPLLDKLFPSRKSFGNGARSLVPSNVGAAEDDRSSALWLGTDQVRILLFRECEWRGRKLLFDSVTLKKQRCKNETSACNAVKNNTERKSEGTISFTSGHEFERGRTAEDDVSLLSEMVFGTVAMTYKGSSFKVHSMNTPPCIMCTKIFPATEHNACKQSERVSDEGLGRSVNLDSNSSVRTLLSRPSSGNLSGNDLSVRKNSTCSNTGSGWDIDIPPPMGSSQSLESNGSSGIGSLSSLRRRWLRAVSTSLARSDSDDAFGMQHWGENGNDTRDGHVKRHKTRLGLTMLVRLTQGNESEVETRLLEHMALLEGMLDRLRYFCIETSNINLQGNCKSVQLCDRICKASSRFVISLMRMLMSTDASIGSRSPLLWHDVLLNSSSTEEKTYTLHNALQQMCQLLDEVDTKSTNFFLSTVVTAVLTYHLGWVYTALPPHERCVMEKLGGWYPCNPLWAQLGDLYGSVGNPTRVAHTVIAGDSRKTELINSVLSFLSYFIRSGIVCKRQEYRCSTQEDVQEATSLLERVRVKRPYLFAPSRTSNDRENATCARGRKQISSQASSMDGSEVCAPRNNLRYADELTRTKSLVNPLKRSGTVKANLNDFLPKSLESDSKQSLKSTTFEVHREFEHKQTIFERNQRKSEETEDHEEYGHKQGSFEGREKFGHERVMFKGYEERTEQQENFKEHDDFRYKKMTFEGHQEFGHKRAALKGCREYGHERTSFENRKEWSCKQGTFSDPDEHGRKQESLDNRKECAHKNSFSEDSKKSSASSKVKIIVDEVSPQDVNSAKLDAQFDLHNFEKKLDDDERDELQPNPKVEEMQRPSEPGLDTLKLYTSRSESSSVRSMAQENKDSQVYFTLGGEEKAAKSLSRPRLGYNCQCSYTFTRVPSTSAQLPEGVLRKIIQRNFPESSKSMQPPPGTASSMDSRSIGFCLKCNGQGYAASQNYDGSKQLLETPTNATEVLRTCGSTVGDRNVGLSRSNSLEALMEANSVVELPMPRSRKVLSEKTDLHKDTGFTKILVQNKMSNGEANTQSVPETNYTWGLVLQGLTKKKGRRKRKTVIDAESKDGCKTEREKEWWYYMREEVFADVRFPTIDQPVAEALCILADLDTWHVGILSTNTPMQTAPLPVGMSRLVANMLEAFSYVWQKYHSPSHCVGILEAKLREMWLRSEALAEMLMAAEFCDASVANLTSALDLDAADIPLLLAVATSHSPEIAQRFGLTLT